MPITTDSVSLKLDSLYTYTFVSKTDSALSAKTVYQYSADSLEVCHVAYKYNTDLKTWTNSKVDSTIYDNQKRKLKLITYTWNTTTSMWVPTNKTEFTYSGNLVTTIVSNYNTTLSAWIYVNKTLLRNDSKSGKQIFYENYFWNSTYNLFTGTKKTISVLNESADKIRDTAYTWSTNAMDWKNEMTVHNYNRSGKDTLSDYYLWDDATSKWVLTFRYLYKNYTQGLNLFSDNLTLHWNQSASRWDSAYRNVGYIYMFTMETEYYMYVTHMPSGISEWVQTKKSEFRYDEQGRIDTVLNYSFNNNTSLWDKSDNISLVFTESGKVANDVGYNNYDINTQKYKNGFKNIYTYDESGQTILDEEYSWDATAQKWAGTFKIVTDRGNPGRTDRYSWNKTTGEWYGSFSSGTYIVADGKLVIRYFYSWNLDTKSWNIANKDYYYYSEFKGPVIHTGFSTINPVSGKQVSVFPNPARNMVQLGGDDIIKTDIISSAGTLVKTSGDLQNIDISSLPAGLYCFIVTVKNGDKQCLKVIKE
jgi:hypothetical protein